MKPAESAAEQRALRAMGRLAKSWPESLELWTTGENEVHVYRKGEGWTPSGHRDPESAIASFSIPIGAGVW